MWKSSGEEIVFFLELESMEIMEVFLRNLEIVGLLCLDIITWEVQLSFLSQKMFLGLFCLFLKGWVDVYGFKQILFVKKIIINRLDTFIKRYIYMIIFYINIKNYIYRKIFNVMVKYL